MDPQGLEGMGMLKRFVSLIVTASVLMLMACGCSSESRKTRGSNYLGRDTDFAFLTDETTEPVLDPGKPGKPNKPADLPKKVGISLPTKNLIRWSRDGELMKKDLESAGFTVDLQYANNDTSTQESQIASMIASDCRILVIAPIEARSLNKVLNTPKSNEITVISYDRLILDTDAVDYYVTIDNYLVGTLQGLYIVNALDLDNTPGPYNLEIFAGDPGDNTGGLFFNGAMDVLKPYIDSGKLNILSGQKEYDDVATLEWRTERSQNRMEALIATYYSDGTTIDAVLCPNDTIALGVVNALQGTYTGKYPVITGADCDIANVKCIIASQQSMSVFKDSTIMAHRAAQMVQEIYDGKTVQVNDTSTYNNGAKTVPAFLVDSVVVDINNYESILIGGGIYTYNDLS